jgi:autotransporter passenger strand-loop-strand repeat protein
MPYVEQAVVNDGGDAYLCSAIGSGFWIREPKSRLRIGSGATAIDTTIGSGGEVTIGSGASMSCCTVCSGGTLTMYGDDVFINNLTVNAGGIVRYVEDKR